MIIRNMGPPRIYLPSRRRPGSVRPDAILLQGFGTGGRAMEWIARDLARSGMDAVVPRSGGLLGYLQTRRVPQAAARVAALLRDRPGPHRTWLIGHSLGGMIARHVVQCQDHGDAVAGVITLGSPHGGTRTATLGVALGLWAISRAPLDVGPGSKVIRDLNARPWPDEVPLVSIYSRSDWLCVHPAAQVSMASRPASVREVELPGLGHTELLWARSALDVVRATILEHQEQRTNGMPTEEAS